MSKLIRIIDVVSMVVLGVNIGISFFHKDFLQMNAWIVAFCWVVIATIRLSTLNNYTKLCENYEELLDDFVRRMCK